MSKKDLNRTERYNTENNENADYNTFLEVNQDERHNKNARATASVEPNYPRIDTGNI